MQSMNITSLLVILFWTQSCDGVRMLPVYDVRTGESFSFPEKFLHLVLLEQWRDNENDRDLGFVVEHIDVEG